ncbi:hypothetical protein VNO78_23789 [Psophocarpus tetragonolobus]|uniref:Uncharacterized protein n=1 Tax=Psophocarpus tetragonolobus TaxID=3891 RepID=A0AAN9S499_PSOTE
MHHHRPTTNSGSVLLSLDVHLQLYIKAQIARSSEFNDDIVSSVDLENQGLVHDEVIDKVDVVSEKPTASSNGCLPKLQKALELKRVANLRVLNGASTNVSKETIVKSLVEMEVRDRRRPISN